jgi:peptidoglycan/xylan/chitin deacetylase (PgdA/CDA1 family)
MATNTLHIIVRTGAALAVATLVAASACLSQGNATATASVGGDETSATSTLGGVETPAPTARRVTDVAGGMPVSPTESDCPLRFPSPLPNRTRVVPILMYHRINYVDASTPEITRRLTVHPDVFRRQMRWLTLHGYRTITQRMLYDALMCGDRLPRKPIVITFDDGYRDAYTKASPLLARFGMRATAYVITGRISGSDSSFLTWRQLRLLEERGVEIGSHTVSHHPLTALSSEQAYAQLLSSRRVLERRLGHRVPWLAYPIGAYDSRIESLAQRAGYRLAVTTRYGATQSARRPLALRRLRVSDTTGVSGLAAMLAAIG